MNTSSFSYSLFAAD